MTNKKSLKSALLLSGVSLLLSGAMLVGTTFAWFHDTAESAENTITAGTLDVDLEYNSASLTDAADENWKSAKDNSIFKDEDTKKWEPGKMVFSYPIRIANKGTKALKYKITVNMTEDSDSLAEVIQYAVTAYPEDAVTNRDTAWEGYESDSKEVGDVAKETESEALAVVLYWKSTENDDDYNFNDGAEHSFKFTVDVYATQASSEKDTFGNEYDSDVGTVPTVKPAGPAAANEKSEEVYHAVEGGITDVNGVSEALQKVPSIDITAKMTSGIGQGIIGGALPSAAPEGTVSVTPLTYDEATETYHADVSFEEANPQMTVSGICGVVGLLHNAVVEQKDNIQSINIGGTEVDAKIISGLKPLDDISESDPVGFSALVLDGVLNGFMAGGEDPTGGPAWLLLPLTAWATPIMDPESKPGSLSMNVLFSIIQGNIDKLDGNPCKIVITDKEGNAVKYSLMFNVTPKA